jgi:hypothetical protein
MRGVRILGQNWEIPYVFYGDGVNDYKFEWDKNLHKN